MKFPKLSPIAICRALSGKKQNSLADSLYKAMSERSESIGAIARGAGIPQPVLYRFCTGERDLTLRTAAKLADYLGLKLSTIKKGQGEE